MTNAYVFGLVIGLGISMFAGTSRQEAPEPVRRAGRLQVIAHRGDSSHAPENTLASFERAVGPGVDYVELDIHLTKDDQVVVIHDPTVDRTTNGHGRIADMTLAQIQALDAGRWFSAGFAGERVPTLDQVLARMKGRLKVLIEPKEMEAGRPNSAGRGEKLVRLALEAVDRNGMRDQVRFHTFSPTNLMALHKLANGIPYHLLYEYEDERPTALLLARREHASGFNPRAATTTRSQVALAHTLGMTVFLYTIDADGGYSQAADLGADGIVTNDPHGLVEWLDVRDLARATRS
jgi:glycerophosphoryl diester phosphodiesterase